MGQRHQLFVIAKIGARYRGLAAIHHQWLYGATALKVCRRLLHIFQSPENRVALEHELRWAKTLGENDWDADEPYIPFPFILTCLVLGASFNEKEGYYYKVQRLPFNLPFDEGDNNDGITVLDISDLGNVKYCFVDYQGMESAREVEMMTPVEASEYLWAYYDEGNEQFQRAFGELVKTFKGRDLVDARALDSAWPSDDWKERGGGKHPKDTFPETGSLSDALPSIKTSTLRALSLAKVLNEACTCSINDLHAVIESAKLLSVFWPAVKSKLYKEPKLVSQFPAACQLLTMVLENEATIDLSPFDLSAEQIHQILLERPSQSREVTSLNLSGKLLDEDLFRKVLASSPSIRTLYLLDTPHIPLRTKFSLLQGTRVSELYDSELYRRPFIEKRPKRSNRPPPKLDPVPTYINPPVVQMVLVACGHATGESGHLRDYVRFPDGGLDLSKLLEHTGGFRFCHSEPLTELNLSPNSVLFGLGQYLQYFTSGDNDNTLSLHESRHDVGPVLGMSLALNVEGKEYKVGPVCDALYRHYDNMGWPTGVRNPVEISADEWTFVLVSEPGSVPGYLRMPTKRYPTLRYAFITVKGQGTADSVVIADAEMFIEHVMPGKEAEQMRREVLSDWNKHVENRYLEDDPENGMKLCGRKEIESLLRSSAFCVLEKKGEEAVVDN